jgi:hypothetical protein
MAKREVRCEACDTLNRVPGYSIKRIPQCGQCHAVLPETRSKTWLRGVYVIRFPIAVTAFAVLLAWILWEPLTTKISTLNLSQKSTFWFNDPTSIPGYAPDQKPSRENVKPRSKLTFGFDGREAAGSGCAKRAFPPHGLYEQYNFSARLARFTIRTAAGASYFVNLEDHNQLPRLDFFRIRRAVP